MYDPTENVDRHNPNYPANDSVWKAQNKCIPARKVKKDKLQMNQNSNSQGNLVVLLIPYFFFHKKIGCLSSEDSTFTQEDIQAVWSHHPWILCTVQSQQHSGRGGGGGGGGGGGVITLVYFATCKAHSIPPPPPPPHGRFLCIGLLPERTPTVFLQPNAKRPFTDSSPFFK